MNATARIINVLKSTTPFEIVSEELLGKIAERTHIATYHPGEIIYKAGAAADDIYVVASGKVEHAFDPDLAVASELVTVVGPGAVFGWAALFKQRSDFRPRYRLAKTTSLQESELLIINSNELATAFESDPATKESVMARFETMITRQYGFTGFVNIRGKLVPAHIANADEGPPPEYDTFAF